MKFYLFFLFFLIKSLSLNAEDRKNEIFEKDTLYVIQVIKTTKSETVRQVIDKLIDKYPDQAESIYCDFKAPYQRVFIGNFISKKEAEEFRNIIKKDFPDSIIVPVGYFNRF